MTDIGNALFYTSLSIPLSVSFPQSLCMCFVTHREFWLVNRIKHAHHSKRWYNKIFYYWFFSFCMQPACMMKLIQFWNSPLRNGYPFAFNHVYIRSMYAICENRWSKYAIQSDIASSFAIIVPKFHAIVIILFYIN